MTSSAPNPGTRSIDLSVEIDAPPEAVWEAISDGDRLASWFAPFASVEPGEGGSVTVAWEEGGEWSSRIAVWQPERHLRLVDELPEDADGAGVEMALDYHLEARDGTTVLHLVNSGLPAGEESDEFFHMMTNGWRFFLWNLKHVVERHPGVSRTMISARPWVRGSREDVWERLFSEEGLGVAPNGPPSASGEVAAASHGTDSPRRAQDPFRFVLDGGKVLEGTVVLCDRPWAFAGRVASLEDGVLHVEMEGSGERWKLGVWLSAYGVEGMRCEEIGKALETTVQRLFHEHR